MATSILAQVWSADCTARGPHRLVLLALADCASSAGIAQISERALGDMVAMPKTTLRQTIAGLVEMGFVRVKDAGAGGRATAYQLSPLKGTQTADENERCDKTVDWINEAPPTTPLAPFEEAAMRPGAVMAMTLTDPELVTQAQHMVKVEQRSAIRAVTGINNPDRGRDADATLVPRIVEIAGLKNPTGAPFYWNQVGHRKEAEALASKVGGPAALLSRLERLRDNARIPVGLTRIAALTQVVEGAR
jgi:hypothetical protein